MTKNLTAVRKKAWRTRRKKYGNKGHSGAYRCGYGAHQAAARIKLMERAIIGLHVDEVLTEGQAAKMTGLDRIRVREIADDIIMERENG